MDIGHMCCNMFHLRFCLLQWFPRIVNVTCDCWLNCLLSLPFLPLNILFRVGRSLLFCLLIDTLCKGPFSEHFQIYRLQLSTLFCLVFFSLSIWGLNFSVVLSFLLISIREKSYLEHNFIIHVFLLIRISKPTNRQQEQNMIK